VGAEVCDVYGAWAKNSVGDVVGIIIQMLEVSLLATVLQLAKIFMPKALAFIHQRNVAHRVRIFLTYATFPWKFLQDAFHDNFLVQWHPESLATKKISTSTPRVYLTDFEVAVEFPAECPAEDQLCNGLPINGSFSLEKYSRPHAPELQSGKSYNPFKLDIWQLGTCFSQPRFKVRNYYPAFLVLTSWCLLDKLFLNRPGPYGLDRLRSRISIRCTGGSRSAYNSISNDDPGITAYSAICPNLNHRVPRALICSRSLYLFLWYLK
jgi:serine/threonine protein kinase